MLTSCYLSKMPIPHESDPTHQGRSEQGRGFPDGGVIESNLNNTHVVIIPQEKKKVCPNTELDYYVTVHLTPFITHLNWGTLQRVIATTWNGTSGCMYYCMYPLFCAAIYFVGFPTLATSSKLNKGKPQKGPLVKNCCFGL